MTRRLFLVVAALASAAAASEALAPSSGTLTRAERVQAHGALERVYYNRRLWPKENASPKPPFDQSVPAALIEMRAAEPLLMSAVLRQLWGVDITTTILQAEMERMERHSRDRAVLHELFAALGNDPLVIAETLARRTVAEELLRLRYAFDPTLHETSRRRAEEVTAKVKQGAAWPTTDAGYSRRLIECADCGPPDGRAQDEAVHLSSDALAVLRERLPDDGSVVLSEDESGWLLERQISGSGDRIEVESLSISKRAFDEWWTEVAAGALVDWTQGTAQPDSFSLPAPGLVVAAGCDVWDGNMKQPLVAARNHTAVWTGSEMIVWGGYGNSVLNTGGRYSPATDIWIPTSTGANVPVAREAHSAVWTGSEMIVWGGYAGTVGNYLNTGGRYNPVTYTWSSTATGAAAPAARDMHTAVWTGGEMVVWGGRGLGDVYLNSGGRYDPSIDKWIPTSIGANVPAVRDAHTAVWTGSEMIVWGGYSGIGNTHLNSGGRFDPSTDTWTPTSTGANVPMERYGHIAVWSGSEMIVWGGDNSGSTLNTGGRYNPAIDTWIPTSVGVDVPASRVDHTGVWASGEMIVWGGVGAGLFDTGGRYDPATDVWASTSIGANVPAARFAHTAVWTGGEMIVWGGSRGVNLDTGGRYNPASDTWMTTSIPVIPAARLLHTAVWTGSEMIVWGGFTRPGGPLLKSGGRYYPATDTWIPTEAGASAPTGRYLHTAVWSGSAMIVWGGFGGTYRNTGGLYNPLTDGWTPTSVGASVPTGRASHSAVWTGSQLLVWGGFNGAYLNTGGRYDSATDTWQETSLGANAPTGRRYHSGVWTGSEMLVWAGFDGAYLNTGGRYDAATDSWLVINGGLSAPAPRRSHTALWVSNEMIVWGGSDGTTLNTGGRYMPATDAWTATSVGGGVPNARTSHTAVWSGSEMIVWGGSAAPGLLNTGGRYDPTTDAWSSTSIGANVPARRSYHTAIWTGDEMIVWGGDGGVAVNTGGIYSVDAPGPVGATLRVEKSTTVDLFWTVGTGATFHVVRRCAAPCIPSTIVGTSATGSYTETMDGTDYFYLVEAANACGSTP